MSENLIQFIFFEKISEGKEFHQKFVSQKKLKDFKIKNLEENS